MPVADAAQSWGGLQSRSHRHGLPRGCGCDDRFRVSIAAGRLPSLKEHSPGGPMHTHDMENHDNLYADEVAMRSGETPADAGAHALWAVALIAAMVVGLGIGLAVF